MKRSETSIGTSDRREKVTETRRKKARERRLLRQGEKEGPREKR